MSLGVRYQVSISVSCDFAPFLLYFIFTIYSLSTDMLSERAVVASIKQ